MITKKVNRYYCEYCKKSGCSGGHIRKHERHCTMNPNRLCRVCRLGFDPCVVVQSPIEDMLAVLPEPPNDIAHCYDSRIDEHREFAAKVEAAMPDLRKVAGDCPACILAALRQKRIPVPMVASFDYAVELKNIWANINSGRSYL